MTIFLYTITITLIILFPISLAIALRRQTAVPWWLFMLGAATFIGSQLYHIPLNNWLTNLGVIGPVAKTDTHFLRTAIILGLSAGASETAARAVGYWFLFRHKATTRWEDGIMVGLGHGGIEAMGLIAIVMAASISSLWAMRGTDLSTLNLSSAQLELLTGQLSALSHPTWEVFLPLLERILAVTLHVILSLLVWYAFQQRNLWYGVAAVLYHGIFDFTAVFLSQSTGAGGLYTSFFLLLIPGLIWTWRTWSQQPHEKQAAVPIRTELALFGVSLRKEMQQQWRTKRMLVVVSVFLLFGLGSPLLAKYTPQMLTMVEGAEQFADLIPEPTQADALGQYIKNITQFGFIIAVLMGMGSVAGEKDKGQVALVLSKPLPRWAFLLSKFTAQACMYAAAFAVAAIGAYYYTMILFEPFQLGAFLCGNALLLLWLLTYTAVTLFGSTVSRSIGQGAGVALVGAVILLLAGSLPRIGSLAPSGLAAWASQLGLTTSAATAPTANGGALVTSIVLILILLIGSIAAFEAQEL